MSEAHKFQLMTCQNRKGSGNPVKTSTELTVQYDAVSRLMVSQQLYYIESVQS